MARTVRRYGRAAAIAALLGVAAFQVGAGPFLAGIRAVGAGPLLAVAALTAVATTAAAWRWHVLAEAFGMGLPMPTAVAAYYRSQFLNSVLPGGVAGDVLRGVRHGRVAGSPRDGLRAVVWDRMLGQVVQLLVTVGVLAAVATPLLPLLAPVLLVVVAVAAILLLPRARRLPGPVVAVAADWRALRRRPQAVVPLVLSSIVVVACHTAVFLIAAAAVGVRTPPAALVPLALVVLAAMAVPLGVGGWGAREGSAAWAFAASGLGAGAGVAAATAYGVLALVAVLPGALVLAAERWRPRLRGGHPASGWSGRHG